MGCAVFEGEDSEMTPERIAEIKARCEAATEGPWDSFDPCDRECATYCDPSGCKGHETGKHLLQGPEAYNFDAEIRVSVEDGAFIAHARQDLPDCIAEIERLQKFEQCTKCAHDYAHINATCPGHADAGLPCAGFEERVGAEMSKDESTPEQRRIEQLEADVKKLRHRLSELEQSVRGHMTYHSHVGGPEK